MTWQKIETAPKDLALTLILGWNKEKGVRETRWTYNGFETGWILSGWSVWYPTHWMPLPDPPTD